MTAPDLARLGDVAEMLRVAGYELATCELAGFDAILGETRYALVACVEFKDWDRLDDRVFDVQAVLTRMAEDAPSVRAWDLYVVALVLMPTRDSGHQALAEVLEADTRYARKFVRIAVTRDALDRALRPLLPLRPPAGLEIGDPLGELRDELRALSVADDVINTAVDAFRRTNAVEVR